MTTDTETRARAARKALEQLAKWCESEPAPWVTTRTGLFTDAIGGDDGYAKWTYRFMGFLVEKGLLAVSATSPGAASQYTAPNVGSDVAALFRRLATEWRDDELVALRRGWPDDDVFDDDAPKPGFSPSPPEPEQVAARQQADTLALTLDKLVGVIERIDARLEALEKRQPDPDPPGARAIVRKITAVEERLAAIPIALVAVGEAVDGRLLRLDEKLEAVRPASDVLAKLGDLDAHFAEGLREMTKEWVAARSTFARLHETFSKGVPLDEESLGLLTDAMRIISSAMGAVQRDIEVSKMAKSLPIPIPSSIANHPKVKP